MTTTNKPKRSRVREAATVRAAVALIRERGCAPGELAALLDLSQSWVTRARAAGLPRTATGRHDPARVLEWIRESDRERPPVVAGSDSSPDLERWRRARADLAELDLDARRGSLVDRREVVDYIAKANTVVVTRMTLLVGRMQSVFGEEIGKELQTETGSICSAFERGLEHALAVARELAAAATPDAATETPAPTTTATPNPDVRDDEDEPA